VVSRLLRARTPADISESVRRVIDIVSMMPDTVPVGSSKFEAFRFPGDVDLFEYERVALAPSEAAPELARRVQAVVERIGLTPDIYFSELKAGEDPDIAAALGTSSLGRIVSLGEECTDDGSLPTERSSAECSVVVGYDSRRVRSGISSLVRKGALGPSVAGRLRALVRARPSLQQWSRLAEEIRKLRVQRWTLDEARRGWKELPGGRHLTLAQAVAQGTRVKVDTWALINQKFVELTDVFSLAAVDPETKRDVLLTEPLGDYVANISADIAHYASQGKWMKVAKRLWMRSAWLLNDDRASSGAGSGGATSGPRDSSAEVETLRVLLPLFSTDAAAVGQAAADAEALHDLLSLGTHRIPRNQVILHILTMFKSVSSHVDPRSPLLDDLWQMKKMAEEGRYGDLVQHLGAFAEKASALSDSEAALYLCRLPQGALASAAQPHICMTR